MDRRDEAPADADVDGDVDAGIILNLEGYLKLDPLEVGIAFLQGSLLKEVVLVRLVFNLSPLCCC